ncbi:MAG TPA: hypothetical protein VGO01_10225 [Bradyrhizobium sp.]|nr:hypothetical protein [Bradyrhizobium sp.]
MEGAVAGPEFEKLALEKAAAGGLSFDPPRWFCDDGELFRANGKTYAFSKMWGGKKWHRAMELLKEKISSIKN